MTNQNINPNIDNVIESEEYRRQQQLEQATDSNRTTAWQRFKFFFGGKRTKFAFGVILLFAGVFLLLSLMSYFQGAGVVDQNRVDNHSVIENAQQVGQMSNAGAAVGAAVSNFFGGGLGLAAFFAVGWCLVLGWRTVRHKDDVRFIQTTFYCLFSAAVFSLVFGLVDLGIGKNFTTFGGIFGRSCNNLLIGLFGPYGLFVGNIVALLIWGMVSWSTLKKMISPVSDYLKQRKPHDNDDNGSLNIDNAVESDEYRLSQKREQAIDRSKTTVWQRFIHFMGKGSVRISLGIILLFTGLYLLLAFISYFLGAGLADQNCVDNHSLMENAREVGHVSNAGAAVGATVSNYFAGGLGLAVFFAVGWCFLLGWRMVRRKENVRFLRVSFYCLFSAAVFSLVLGFVDFILGKNFLTFGGTFGHESNNLLTGLIGSYGMYAVNVIVLLLWVWMTWNMLTSNRQDSAKQQRGEIDETHDHEPEFLGDSHDVRQTVDEGVTPSDDNAEKDNESTDDIFNPGGSTQRKTRKRRLRDSNDGDGEPSTEGVMMNAIETAAVSNPHDPTGEYRHYRFPTLELLQDITMRNDSVDVAEQEANKQRITETLNNYGISIKEIQVHVGPTVTLFEIVPVEGIRISKIRNLEDDIALSLKALGVRIIAPMPGRGTIGIEVPNHDPQIVPMRQVLASKAFQESKAKLPMCLGCTVSNEVFVADLTKMPHLLVAGATGKGKSVGLNAIITSLLYKKGPSELKFVLVDPKRVEFSVYADLEKYFFAKAPGEERAIVTDTNRVVHTLNCLVQEMEDRYQILEEVKVRKVEDYNEKWRSELREIRDADGNKRYHYMPYIVAIIDEFSDMIMTAGKEVETPIVRIAQKARAVGIHMIIATQRPSSNVITGLIKGNFPGRIAFAVSQMIDSRIIIDRSGAQHLIGRGDMLFSIDGELTRLQCPFVDTPDIVSVCDFIKEQEDNDRDINHEMTYMLPEYVAVDSDGASGGVGSGKGGGLTDRDPLFAEAVRWIVQGDVASTSSLQRRYEIGYNRAGRIMDQMEAAGIVGPASGGKPRKVLLSPIDVEQILGG